MKCLFSYVIIVAFTAGGFLISSCGGNSPVRFYVLSPTKEVSRIQTEQGRPWPIVGVGPIKMPRYLDRPQIVTSSGESEIFLSENDRWAEPLTDNFTRVIAQNLYALRCAKNVVTYPWSPSISCDYVVKAEVLRMDGTLGGTASLEVWWSIADGVRKGQLVSKRSNYNEPTKGPGYAALVEAQNRALGDFSREIAEELMKLCVPSVMSRL